ncbi:MAG: hypothetical protein UW86_C0013G0017 [Microgenomates group bacterium GW2011_GWA1_Microgenomates_45_10]|nr:MAG: hypothetical protein UW86_C0013G0017 [Microgenomates group bacterium GW2011_GWA1_Microgenomates_45_10]
MNRYGSGQGRGYSWYHLAVTKVTKNTPFQVCINLDYFNPYSCSAKKRHMLDLFVRCPSVVFIIRSLSGGKPNSCPQMLRIKRCRRANALIDCVNNKQ